MKKFLKRLRALWHRRQLDRDLEDELAFHLAMNADQTGDPVAARCRLGNPASLKETCRDLWAFATVETWWQDCRYAWRTLQNSPLVTITAVVALALGIGANTTVFTVVSSALRFDMSVDHIERLVTLQPGEGAATLDPVTPPVLDFRNLQNQVKTIEDLAAYRFTAVNVSDSHAYPERFWRVQMTASAWKMVRSQPILGREFGPRDERPDAPPAVMLSHRVWERRYGRDASIVGKAIRIDDVPHIVIGVMPAGAQFPEDTELWTPITIKDIADPNFRRSLLLFGRLAPGATLTAAQSEVDGVARRAFPGKVNGPLVRVRPFLEMIGVYDQRAMLIVMVVAVGFVLLIVCADVANLLLARAAARAREISIRIAIGAGRARIVRQLLVESVMLAAAGGIAGWIVALGGLAWFDRMSAQGRRPSWLHFTMDAHGFAYLAAITIGAGVLFGLAPAFQLAKVDVYSSIKDGGRGAEGSASGRRLAGLLVGFQMALCVVLLAGAGLMIHSTVNLYSAPLAINPANVLTMQVSLPEAKYPTAETVRDFYTRLKTSLASLPGASEVSLASNIPMSGWREMRGEVEGAVGKPGRTVRLNALFVDPNYFHALAIALRRGQSFDPVNAQSQVVVNESFAARYWPHEDPLGRRLRLANPRGVPEWLTVAGVVADAQQDRINPIAPSALIYIPNDLHPQRTLSVVARTTVAPGTLADAFRRTVQNLDENLPAEDLRTLDEHISQQRLNTSAFGKLFSLFAAIALVLAWVGLYAVVAHAVSRRTQEIGIRMAMGGTRRNIFGLVLRQGMWQVAGGFATGIPLAFLVTRALSRSLIGVSPADPATYGGVALLLAFAGILGCAIPARRAVRVDPLSALRHE